MQSELSASAPDWGFQGIIDSAPTITLEDATPTRYSSFIYDSKGNQMAKLIAEDSNRVPVTMDQIPTDLANAFVAIEDERFYQHNGIDIMGILRAGVTAVKTGFNGRRVPAPSPSS
ncbi:MAG: transglycosylase domain-containing protein [Gallintestinimicrobium sp.]